MAATKTQPPVKQASSEATSAEHTKSDAAFVPNVDIVEQADSLTLLVDLPGTTAEAIDVDYNNGLLAIYAKVAPRHGENGVEFLNQEYGVGDFYRTFQVSEDIDAKAITADYKNGVLQLRLPKAEAVKPRKIAVN
jgi:HSP20 family molecular chaperone IbpA